MVPAAVNSRLFGVAGVATAALSAAVTRLVGDAELRTELGREGQRRFTEQFRHQTMTRRIRQLYQQVLGGLDRAIRSAVTVWKLRSHNRMPIG